MTTVTKQKRESATISKAEKSRQQTAEFMTPEQAAEAISSDRRALRKLTSFLRRVFLILDLFPSMTIDNSMLRKAAKTKKGLGSYTYVCQVVRHLVEAGLIGHEEVGRYTFPKNAVKAYHTYVKYRIDNPKVSLHGNRRKGRLVRKTKVAKTKGAKRRGSKVRVQATNASTHLPTPEQPPIRVEPANFDALVDNEVLAAVSRVQRRAILDGITMLASNYSAQDVHDHLMQALAATQSFESVITNG